MQNQSSNRNYIQVSENWQKIYQTFRGADFQSYDFESLRKSMIDYLRLYYPEEFNDFIESSEFIAFIDLLSFLGQSLAFRNDLNIRENFIDTAERRESVLRLARLVNYNPKRNNCASGLLKIVAVRTSENVFDSNGINLSGRTIFWSDLANGDWQEQFYTVINSSLVEGQRVGNPSSARILGNIKNEEYQIDIPPQTLPVYGFSQQVEGMNLNFEAVGSMFDDSVLIESPPIEGSKFGIIAKNDQKGFNSNNTGFFVFFKQGSLNFEEQTFLEPTPNRIWSIERSNINRSDVWVYELDSQSNIIDIWQQVPSVVGSNIAYNDIRLTNRKIYEVVTKNNDQIDIQFGDGTFAQMPQGRFVVLYRTSAGVSYRITPSDLQSVTIPLTYLSKSGRVETLSLTMSLQYTVNNSAPRETTEEIRRKAPQQYYTQNRMVTGEDYQLFPYTAYSDILKIKSVNRTSSGVSRFYDLSDNSGKYSFTDIISDDGAIYFDNSIKTDIVRFPDSNRILDYIKKTLVQYLRSHEYKNFYYSDYNNEFEVPRPLSTLSLYFNLTTYQTNNFTGYFFQNISGQPTPQPIGNLASSVAADVLRMIKPGAILKFQAPPGKKFNKDNVVVSENSKEKILTTYAYIKVLDVVGDGANQGQGNLITGLGPVTLSDPIYSNVSFPEIELPKIVGVFPPLLQVFDVDFEVEMTQKIFREETFYIVFNEVTTTYNFSNTSDADVEKWICKFEFRPTTKDYLISYRQTKFVFESAEKVKFFVEPDKRVYDATTSSIVTDQIFLLEESVKTPLSIIDYFGNSQQTVSVVYSDLDQDGVSNNLEFFDQIVNTDPTNQDLIFFDGTGKILSEFVNRDYPSASLLTGWQLFRYPVGQIFYFSNNEEHKIQRIKEINQTQRELESLETLGYSYKIGKSQLVFQYKHVSGLNRRIDPSRINLIDLYILTSDYAQQYKRWLADQGNSAPPTPPTSENLRLKYSELEKYKPISDTIIFNPSKIKVLFGNKKTVPVNGRFYVKKTRNSKMTDVELRTSIVRLVNEYFDLESWDFGDTFYFTDLASYLHINLPDNLASVRLQSEDQSVSSDSIQIIRSSFDEIISAFISVSDVIVE